MADQAKKKASEALARIGYWLKDQKAREHPTAGGYGSGTAGKAHLDEEKRLEGARQAMNIDAKRTEYFKGLKEADGELYSTQAAVLRRKGKLQEAKQNTYNDNSWNEQHPDIEGRRRMLDKAIEAADARMDAAFEKKRSTHQSLNKGFAPQEEAYAKMGSKADLLNKTGNDLNRKQVEKLLSELKKPKPLGSKTADRLLNEGADHARLQSRKESTIAATTILGAGAAGGAGAVYRSSWSQKKDAERK
jgi:hypothetical protein